MADAAATVFVVDDDPSVRETLRVFIGVEGCEVLTFASGEAFLACPPADGPSCLVLDIRLPGVSGLDLQAQIAPQRSHMPVIVMSAYGDVPMSVRAMKAGAAEFLSKPLDRNLLLDAVNAALQQSRTAVVEQARRARLRDRHASLSDRERQVMALVVTGLTNKQVGRELGIAEITVKVHRRRVMDKMQAGSLAALVTMSAAL